MKSTKGSKRKLATSVNTSVRVSQKITLVKYAVAGTIVVTLLGVSTFLYLNLADSDDAKAGASSKGKPSEAERLFDKAPLVNLSHLTSDEMDLMANRDFVRDTIRKEYVSVKWNLNGSLSHLTLEVSDIKHEFSLSLYDQNGYRVLYFTNLTSEKVFVDKIQLTPNHRYQYLVLNSIGEMYAGNLKFN